MTGQPRICLDEVSPWSTYCTIVNFSILKRALFQPADLETPMNIIYSAETLWCQHGASYSKTENLETVYRECLFIASHHGRTSAFYRKVIDYCSPTVIVFSDGLNNMRRGRKQTPVRTTRPDKRSMDKYDVYCA